MIRAIVTAGLNDIEKSVVKATYDDENKPKEKHVVFLIDCSSDYSFLEYFQKRLQQHKWNIVLKAMIVLHRISIEGSERFMKELSNNGHLFQLSNFSDTTSIISQEHSRFIHEYSQYLLQKLYVYKLLHVSIERRPPSESKSWALQLSVNDLVKSLPALSMQFDKLISCTPYNGSEFTNPIIVSCMTLMVKDAFRLYSLLTVEMLVVLEKYEEMNLDQCKLMLKCCQKFMEQNERFKTWVTSLDELGFASSKLMPNFDAIPPTFIQILKDHVATLSGQPPSSAASSSSSSKPASSAASSSKVKKSSDVSPVAVSPKPSSKPAAASKPAAKPKRAAFESDSESSSDSDDEEEKAVEKGVKKLSVAKTKQAEPEEESGEDEDDEAERKRAKKERKEARRLKKAAKKAKKEKKKEKEKEKGKPRRSAGEVEGEVDSDSDTPVPRLPRPAAHSTNNNDLTAMFGSNSNQFDVFASNNDNTTNTASSLPVSVPVPVPLSVPVSVPIATPSPAYAPPPYGAPPPGYAGGGYGAPPPYGYAPAPYGYYPPPGAAQANMRVPYMGTAAPNPHLNANAHALSQLTPLTQSRAPTSNFNTNNTTAADPADPFADLAPQFSNNKRK